jgi:hypothetical protein
MLTRAAIALWAAALAGCGAQATAVPSEPSSYRRPVLVPAADAATARKAFALFGRPQERIPQAVERALRYAHRQLKLDPRFTRTVPFRDGSIGYVASGSTAICIGALEAGGRAGGMSCAATEPDLERLAAGRLGGGIVKITGGYRVFALVPDGSTAARITVGRSTRTLTITRNFVSATTRRPPRDLTFTAPDGAKTGSTALAMWRKDYDAGG